MLRVLIVVLKGCFQFRLWAQDQAYCRYLPNWSWIRFHVKRFIQTNLWDCSRFKIDQEPDFEFLIACNKHDYYWHLRIFHSIYLSNLSWVSPLTNFSETVLQVDNYLILKCITLRYLIIYQHICKSSCNYFNYVCKMVWNWSPWMVETRLTQCDHKSEFIYSKCICRAVQTGLTF